MASSTVETTRPTHPLDPLSASEIERAWEILREARALGPRVRVIFSMLHEPAKKVVLGHRPGDAVERTACVVVVDRAEGKTYEATVSLSDGRVVSWEHVPGAQPAIVLDEFVDCEAAVRADPRWQEAMRKRGVTAIDALGADFDPNVHQAVIHESSAEHREGEVMQELQRGYKLGDRLLRPAMVKVAKHP